MRSPSGSSQIVPVILSGGAGSRLWPVSRRGFPKQFWALAGGDSMLVETARRAAADLFTAPVIVANEDHRFIIAEQLRAAGIANPRILLEPCGRNSAPAIAAAAMLVAETDPHAILLIMPADAAISDGTALRAAIESGLAAAELGRIVTFGMRPTGPETGYGYITTGDRIAGLHDVHAITRFTEKPDAATAAELCKTSLWNSGMFMASAATWLAELQTHAGAVYTQVKRAFQARRQDLEFIRLEAASFAEAENISIDYAVAEKTDKAVVVPAAIGWSDVGSWAALAALATPDESGNAATGDVLFEASENCFVRGETGVTALLGVRDLVVVVTKDAVLVAHKAATQHVKRVVERLERAGAPQAALHNRIYRPWGFYECLIMEGRFQVKRIVVFPGRQLSLQKHFHRSEHWVVVEGCALVTRDAEVRLVQENESIYLPLGCIHRMENPGKIPLAIIEVQSGPYLGEDDIVRFEDSYGRA